MTIVGRWGLALECKGGKAPVEWPRSEGGGPTDLRGRCLDGCYGKPMPYQRRPFAQSARGETKDKKRENIMGEQGGQRAEEVEMEGGSNSQTTSQNKLQRVRVSMTTAHQGRSPLASEAAPIEAEAVLPYVTRELIDTKSVY